MFTSGQVQNLHGASRKVISLRQSGDWRCFSPGLSLPVALGTRLCPGSHSQPRPPRGSGLVTGAAPQLLPPNSPGFQAGRWAITPLLSGISYFRSCIYILEAAA